MNTIDNQLSDISRGIDRIQRALLTAQSALKSIAGEHGNRNGADWCHGPCAHSDCIAHLALNEIDKIL
jgi:hypothetical protein